MKIQYHSAIAMGGPLHYQEPHLHHKSCYGSSYSRLIKLFASPLNMRATSIRILSIAHPSNLQCNVSCLQTTKIVCIECFVTVRNEIYIWTIIRIEE